MSTVLKADVKLRLHKTLTVDEPVIQAMIDAAEAEYAEYVIGVVGSSLAGGTAVTKKYDGGGDAIVLGPPSVTTLTAAAYVDGAVLTLTDLELDTNTGIVHWKYGTRGRFLPGPRRLSLTFTLGALPPNHREVIITDVAGYFAATQRGSVRPAFAGEGGITDAYIGQPQVLFPRIRALAASYPTVA